MLTLRQETTDRGNESASLQALSSPPALCLLKPSAASFPGLLALLADAGHMLTDSAALLFALLRSASPAVPPTPATRSAGCA
ncbi:hypothetical protein DMH17_10380 [Raoultella planticola]|nr:hypothetical protein [Raoultella planticola]